MTQRLETTSDGSHTVYSEQFKASYHSTHGSIQESMVVFIENGLKYIQKSTIDILEIGFGTGLNAALTYDQHISLQKEINYVGIEKYPISLELAKSINYKEYFSNSATNEMLLQMHKEHSYKSTNSIAFESKVLIQDVFDFNIVDSFDLIYFDAFAPSIQEAFWQAPFLERMFKALRTNGVLTTYCAQGQFKRNLKSVGFQVESLPGPKGKREMTRAIKI